MFIAILISTKLSTPGFLKIYFKIDYDVIISVNDVTNKILSRYSHYLVDVII